MSKSKNKNFLSVIESFFQKNSDSAIQAITRAIKAMKFTGRIPTLKTKHNASVKTSEKLVSLLLLPFFGCKDVSHLGTSPAGKWLKVGYNMLYRLLREDKIDWRNVMEHVSRRVGKYIDDNCEKAEGLPRCLVVDDSAEKRIQVRLPSDRQLVPKHGGREDHYRPKAPRARDAQKQHQLLHRRRGKAQDGTDGFKNQEKHQAMPQVPLSLYRCRHRHGRHTYSPFPVPTCQDRWMEGSTDNEHNTFFYKSL